MMRCLVTGGCGFVGSALVRRLLAESCEVLVVDDLSRGSRENFGADRDLVRVIEQDVTDGLDRVFSSFQPQAVFHLAALHFIPDCDADPARCLRVNVDGTRSVLQAAAGLRSPASLVLASSAAVYAPADGPHREQEDSLGPVDVYGYSKRWTEELAAGFAARTGTGVGIARLFNVFGPGETNAHFIPSLICQMKAGESVRLGNLSTRRDYVFVDDVADALLRLARHCGGDFVPGQAVTVNVGSGRAYSGHDVVEALTRSMTGTEPAAVAPVVDPSRLRPVDRPTLLADPTLAQKLLDWAPRTSLADGLRAAWDRPVGAGVTLT
ncbi:NAD-dependent epimerase/dehydratase family protein [Actinocrinis puniceicyclus]|uniref:NAD-dependent epimerase/dehydratase family protein n=1 Tax=Actinocrinis puniceicyclus TaxID=977794 RepID=A0A8J7WQ08_9ACTN|nr:NAD-dependent epimerase/dehydratase family protein [Actinocrinis puniceicyclus]MBS2964715.1 NAD-dependent epimerase/dehydratase family protein [Actinocrinis puniceicyclus]